MAEGAAASISRTRQSSSRAQRWRRARTARDTAFGSGGANEDDLADFQGDQYLGILLKPTTGAYTVETYLPGNEGNAYDNTQWANRTSTTATDSIIDARIAAPARANSPSGTFGDARIPASVARDAEIASYAMATNPTGTIPDAQVPAAIMRDAELTGPAVRTLLEALTGNEQLNAAALRLIADAVDTELGSNAWRTGGMGVGLTAAEIVALLESLTGDDRLNATAALRLIADALDTELGQADWRRGEDQIAAHTYIATGATWDAANHTIEATVTGLTTIETGDEFILVLPSALPGQGAPDASLSLNGESRLLFRPLDDGLGRVPSRELVPSSIVLLFRSNVGYRFLEPHILERAGVWRGGRIYLQGQDVIRNGTDYKLLNETSVGEDPATHPEIWLPFPHVWQFGGITLGPTITGINFEGAGVVSSVNNGIWTLTIAAGGVPPEPPTDDFYWGTSADATPEGAELTIAAVNGAATIPAYVGSMHVLIARLETEDDLIRVVRSDDISQTNQLGGFTKFGSTVVPTGETLAFNVWVSNQNLTQTADVIWTAS